MACSNWRGYGFLAPRYTNIPSLSSFLRGLWNQPRCRYDLYCPLPHAATLCVDSSAVGTLYIMDPVSIIGGVGAVLTVISEVTKLSKNLNQIREKYKNVALNTTLVASQLSTIRAALEAIANWRRTADASSQYSKKLDEDLAVSLNCCAILVTVLNSKLGKSGFKPGMKAKINELWLEDVMKEYLSKLEGQVHALQLLLTIFQW